MRVQFQMNFAINRQLQRDSDLSLADYHVLCALSAAAGRTLQVTDLAAAICWERSRLSHHLSRLCRRGLTERVQSDVDGRATNVVLTEEGADAVLAAAPGHAVLVRRLFFDPMPDELLSPFTAALEHIKANLDSDTPLPPL
jgi:DNA-binding MarR family transcriptional regulator